MRARKSRRGGGAVEEVETRLHRDVRAVAAHLHEIERGELAAERAEEGGQEEDAERPRGRGGVGGGGDARRRGVGSRARATLLARGASRRVRTDAGSVRLLRLERALERGVERGEGREDELGVGGVARERGEGADAELPPEGVRCVVASRGETRADGVAFEGGTARGAPSSSSGTTWRARWRAEAGGSAARAASAASGGAWAGALAGGVGEGRGASARGASDDAAVGGAGSPAPRPFELERMPKSRASIPPRTRDGAGGRGAPRPRRCEEAARRRR